MARDSFESNRMCHFFCQKLLFMAKAFKNELMLEVTMLDFSEHVSNAAIFDLVHVKGASHKFAVFF